MVFSAKMGSRDDAEFREMLINIADELSKEEVQKLRYIYLGNSQGIQNGTELMETLTKQHMIRNSEESLQVLKKRLEGRGRMDLGKIVDEFMKTASKSTEKQESELSAVSQLHVSTAAVEESNRDTTKSTISGTSGIRYSHDSKLAGLADWLNCQLHCTIHKQFAIQSPVDHTLHTQ